MKRLSSNKTEVAIIGYGRFGKLAAHYLKKDFRVLVYDRKRLAVETGIKKVSLREAAQKRNILLAVPINQLKSILEAISPLLQHSSLICDVCSVKEQPVLWMNQILPKHVSILGTHPLFGPDSTTDGLKEKSIVLCPVRISQTKLTKVKTLLLKLGLLVHQATPQQHDQIMASTLFLSQFIGRALHDMRLPFTSITTQNFRFLKHIATVSHNDSIELFRDMHKFNRYAQRIPDKLLKEIKSLTRFLSKNRI